MNSTSKKPLRCENHGNALAVTVRSYQNATTTRQYHVACCAACDAERTGDNALRVKSLASTVRSAV